MALVVVTVDTRFRSHADDCTIKPLVLFRSFTAFDRHAA